VKLLADAFAPESQELQIRLFYEGNQTLRLDWVICFGLINLNDRLYFTSIVFHAVCLEVQLFVSGTSSQDIASQEE
jgi:hypothetical protein